MQFEVEQKFAVADLLAVATQLHGLGAVPREAIVQVDHYFAHPARDFAQTDEALRIRQVGERNLITYKGPKIDHATKTRRELELPLAAGEKSAEQWTELLQALGFQSLAAVRKTRQVLDLAWNGTRIEIALDQVDEVGSFVEVETLADESELPQAQSQIQSLAAALRLTAVERQSYLELLLATRSVTG